MKKLLLLIILSTLGKTIVAQQLLDFAAGKNWPSIDRSNIGISNDGRFLYYQIEILKIQTLVVKKINSSWKMEIPKAFTSGTNQAFSDNSKYFIFQTEANGLQSLNILDMSSQKVVKFPKVKNVQTPRLRLNYLAFIDTANTIHVIDLENLKDHRTPKVAAYFFSDNGKVLLTTQESDTPSEKNSLYWHDLDLGENRQIASAEAFEDFIFDSAERQVVFSAKQQTNKFVQLKYYNRHMQNAVDLIDTAKLTQNGLTLKRSLFFNGKGNMFFATTRAKDISVNGIQSNEVERSTPQIKTYQDGNQDYSYNIAVDLKNISNTIILSDKGRLLDCGISQNPPDRYLIQQIKEQKQTGKNWERLMIPEFYVTSVDSNKSERITLTGEIQLNRIHYSALGNYVIWYNRRERNWLTYNCQTKRVKNLTRTVRTEFYSDQFRQGLSEGVGILGWQADDSFVYIYDRYDIWRLDPDGQLPALNITKGFGKANDISFEALNQSNSKIIHPNEKIILSAFNNTTKESGFYELKIGKVNSSLKKLSMLKCAFKTQRLPIIGDYDILPPIMKAKNTSTYFLAKMSETEFPNLYISRDLINYEPITNFQPQKKYNWYTTDLVKWPMSNGELGEGILYKPRNFDPTKRYPVIFYYYESNSFALHYFLKPVLSSGVVNIPTFVSKGYLVFVPDLPFKIGGHPNESLLNIINSAVDHLTKFPYVDSSRLGLNGHSYGGWETNIVIANTNKFAAAAEAAGMTNLIADYGRNNYQFYYEFGQGRIEKTLWETPDRYIQNSPVLKADRVETPLLIMHNSSDYVVPVSHATEWYNALLRNGKKVWMLNYENEGHTLENYQNKLDYSTRLMQFFDYYLLNKPMPIWMTGQGHDLDMINANPQTQK